MKQVDFESTKWSRKRFLYRGTFQYLLEKDLLTSWVNKKEPVYHSYLKEDDAFITFVDPSLAGSLLYCSGSNLKNRLGDTYTYNDSHFYYPFTIYPCVLAINAENYRDRIFLPGQGEGLCIKGDINIEDMTPIFHFGKNKFPEFVGYEEDAEEQVGLWKRINGFLAEIKRYESRLSNKSFIERFNAGEIDIKDIKSQISKPELQFGLSTELNDNLKITESVKNLERFLKN